MKRFNVVISKDDGGVEMYPMKEWLRRHPLEIPGGLDPTLSTSHQLRNALRRSGWGVQETDTEFHLIKPNSSGEPPKIANILGGDSEDTQSAAEGTEATFSLEYQLRDFIAQNIGGLSIN